MSMTCLPPSSFHSAAEEGEAKTGGSEGQEAVFQRAADDAAVQRQQRSGDFDGHVGCGGSGDGSDRGGYALNLTLF